ncbi:hypothetical protein PF008_g14559 [Phytophthora fragariae]|uniref:Uncharacterized protein n=1 Tax=Phytophthora fragariae TaxID=53985 RepID=A0A6G0RHJ4_9STRA|nr:hypothetical protein PF008_g14559 [Phytophthora fragariae]
MEVHLCAEHGSSAVLGNCHTQNYNAAACGDPVPPAVYKNDTKRRAQESRQKIVAIRAGPSSCCPAHSPGCTVMTTATMTKKRNEKAAEPTKWRLTKHRAQAPRQKIVPIRVWHLPSCPAHSPGCTTLKKTAKKRKVKASTDRVKIIEAQRNVARPQRPQKTAMTTTSIANKTDRFGSLLSRVTIELRRTKRKKKEQWTPAGAYWI